MSSEAINPDFVDVRRLMQELSVEELCLAAEEFFAQRIDWESLHAKPFADIGETPELLICFAQVVRGLNLLPDMTILDFGAGSCWTSRLRAPELLASSPQILICCSRNATRPCLVQVHPTFPTRETIGISAESSTCTDEWIPDINILKMMSLWFQVRTLVEPI